MNEQLKELTKPVMEWLNKNGHPHMKVIIETNSVELVEGVSAFTTDEFITDKMV